MAIVAIDAGHGSTTAGKRTVEGYREHWINVRSAVFFERAMRRCGINISRIGWNDENAKDDEDVSLSARQKAVKNSGATVSVSFHANAFGSGDAWNSAQGIETIIHSDTLKANDSAKLAKLVQAELIKGTKQKNRGVKSMNLAMCNCVAMGTKASILIEIGFMTNQYEAGLMKTDAFCKETAEEAAVGVCKYLGVTYVKENTAVKKTKFEDVEAGSWYEEAIAFAVENGYMNGYSDKEFRPDEPLTRGQMAKVLENIFK